jgi:hypothetical protein
MTKRGGGSRGGEEGEGGEGVLTYDACDALDLTRDSRLLRASCDDALQNRNRLIVGGDGEGQVRFGQVEFDGALCAL